MKKLKNKVFITIFLSLSLIVIGTFLLVLTNNRNARFEIKNEFDKNFIQNEPKPKEDIAPPEAKNFNDKIDKELKFNPITTIIVLLLAEFGAFVVAKFLTKWITNPVQKNFDQQKQFIADASHELKTPLAVITASSDAFLKDGNNKWVKNIQTETERMGKLVTSLLDLSHIENTKNYNFKEIDLSNFVESTILTNESLFYESKIKLKYHITPNIKFNCDKDQIGQLVGILIDNAIKYADKNSQVTINLSKENHKILLTFTNKGTPIKKDEEDKIFERFYRSDKARSRKNGSYGLGLAIAKTIVENHHGTISAASKNHHTTFKIIF